MQESGGVTSTGLVIGTAEYMAPEQAAGGHVGPAADVYALGVILYELLIGRPPFRADSTADTLRQLTAFDPVPPHRLRPGVPRDLETVCLKCLDKDPARRYASAEALAHDCANFLAGVPTRARPAGPLGRAAKWVRRRPALASALASLALVTLTGLIAVSVLYARAEDRAVREAVARRQVERLSAGLTLDRGLSLCGQGDVGPGLETLARSVEMAVQSDDADTERLARANLAEWRRHLIRQRYTCQHDSWVTALILGTRDGRPVLLTASLDRTVRFWDPETAEPIGVPLPHSDDVKSAALSPDGRWVLAGTASKDGASGAALVWGDGGEQPVASLPHPAAVDSVAFTADGERFVTVCRRQVQIWATADRRSVGPPIRHGNADVLVAALSPDGNALVTGGADKTVRYWHVASGESAGPPSAGGGAVLVAAFSPDGRVVATGGADGVVTLWDAATGAAVGTPMQHPGEIRAIAFSGDNGVIATAGQVTQSEGSVAPGGVARLWRGRSADRWDAQRAGTPLSLPLPHPLSVWSVALDSRGDWLLTGCEDGGVRLFSGPSGRQVGNAAAGGGTVRHLLFTPDGRGALSGSAGDSVRRWELPSADTAGRLVAGPGRVTFLEFNPSNPAELLAVGPGAARLVTLDESGGVRDLDTRPGERMKAGWSPSGRLVAVGGDGGIVRVHHPSGAPAVGEWREPGPVIAAGFLRDDAIVFTVTADGHLRLRDVSGTLLGHPISTGEGIFGVAARPARREVFIATHGGPVRLWDVTARRPLVSFTRPGWDESVAGSSDGRWLLTGSAFERTAQLWDVETGRPLGPPLAHDRGGQGAVAFGPGGRLAVTGGGDGAARVWDVATGKPVGPPRPHRGPVTGVALCPGGRRLATAGGDGIRVWDLAEPVTP